MTIPPARHQAAGTRYLACIEEESDRRQGKGRRCWLGERIDSVPCRTRILAPGRFEEMVE